jgi:GNAT superfamily N-acetyltransferase
VGRPRVHIEAVAPTRLTGGDREELAAFVAAYIRYPRPMFDAGLDAAAYVWRCRDADGRLVATTAVRRWDSALGRRRVRVLYTTMVAVAPGWRRHGLISAMGGRSYLREVLRAPMRPVYWLALAGSPAGYVQMAHNLSEYWPRPDRPTPPDVDRLLRDALARIGEDDLHVRDGCLCATDAVRVSDPSQRVERWDLTDPAVAFYVRINPDYDGGSALACVAPLRGLDLARAVVQPTVRRLMGTAFVVRTST